MPLGRLVRDFTYSTVTGLLLGPALGMIHWSLIAVFVMPHMIPALVYTAQNHHMADIFYTGALGIFATTYAVYGVEFGVSFGVLKGILMEVHASRYFVRGFLRFFRNVVVQSVCVCSASWLLLLIDLQGFVVAPDVLVEVFPEVVVVSLDLGLVLLWGAIFGLVFERLRSRASYSDENRTMLIILFGVGLIVLGMNLEYLFSAFVMIVGIMIVLAAHYKAL